MLGCPRCRGADGETHGRFWAGDGEERWCGGGVEGVSGAARQGRKGSAA